MKLYHTREGSLEPPLTTEPTATQLVSNTQEFDPQVAWFGKLITQHDRTVTHSCKTSCPQIDPIAFSFISGSDVPARVTQGLRKAIYSYTYHLLPIPAPNTDVLRGSEWWREVQRNTACESNPWQRQRTCPSPRRDNQEEHPRGAFRPSGSTAQLSWRSQQQSCLRGQEGNGCDHFQVYFSFCPKEPKCQEFLCFDAKFVFHVHRLHHHSSVYSLSAYICQVSSKTKLRIIGPVALSWWLGQCVGIWMPSTIPPTVPLWNLFWANSLIQKVWA